MNKSILIVRNIFSRLLFLVVVILFAIPMLIFRCIPFSYRISSSLFFRCVHMFYMITLKVSPIPIKWIGLENIPDEPVIFVANHQSSFDIPLAGMLSKGIPHLFLARADLVTDSVVYRFVVPMLSVLVDVDSARAAMVSLRKIITLIKGQYRNIIIFPEGSRFIDGKVHEFFGGFVILAKKIGRPVLPVYIRGINKAYPPGSFLVYPHEVTIIVGKPFIYQEDDTDEIFKKRVHDWFVEQIG